MQRLFIRGKDQQKRRADGKLNIGVTGLSQSVGATLIASSLAFFFAEKGDVSTYIDCNDPARVKNLLYDSVAMDKRFANRQFHAFYQLIQEGQVVRGKTNMEKEVNWVLITPEDCKEKRTLSQEEKGRLVHCSRGDVAIFDFAGEEGWDYYLLDMDSLIVVVDPLPSKLIGSAERFKKLKRLELSGLPIKWIVNGDNSGISHRQVNGYLKTKDALWVPMLSLEDIYADEFACRFHWENPLIRSKIMDIFTKVSH